MTAAGCGCCAGGRHISEVPTIWNAPGRHELERRIARYPDARERMIARLADEERPALAKLTTRDPADPSIALLDAWAIVEDVITFYDERIANEGYLRTATDRDALAEIAALVGYRPRPGVAASTYLAFEMEKDHDARLEAGIRVRSVPKPGEESQTFESVEDIEARADLNALLPQMRRPQIITFPEALNVPTIWFEGAATSLSAGDVLLLYFGAELGQQIVRAIVNVIVEQEPPDATGPGPSRTCVELAPVDTRLRDMFFKLLDQAHADPRFAPIAADIALGAGVQEVLAATPAHDDFKEIRTELAKIASHPEERSVTHVEPIDPTQLMASLRRRTRKSATAGNAPPVTHDARTTQILAAIAGVPVATFGRAWRTTEEASKDAAAARVFVLRRVVGVFGHNAPKQLIGQGKTQEWSPEDDENPGSIFLDSLLPEVRAGGHVVIRTMHAGKEHGDDQPDPIYRVYRLATSASIVNRSAYGLGGTITRIEVARPWWALEMDDDPPVIPSFLMKAIRRASVYCGSDQLALADEPDARPIGTIDRLPGAAAVTIDAEPPDTIRLDRIHEGIEPGRRVVVTGIQAVVDAAGLTRSLGVHVAEVATVRAVTQERDDRIDLGVGPIRTVVQVAAALSGCYLRSSVRILGNVAFATHGETRSEVLGNGDARVANQSFRTQPGPLTYVASDDPSGITTTLEVRVDDVRWTRVDEVVGPGLAAQVYNSGPAGERTLVRFGDGTEGARPRTGQQNIRAAYRVGIGPKANVDADAISTLITRPLGLKAVTNPVPASGGAGPDAPEAIRERTPIGVTALDRVVSVQDHADFALGFAGVAKAVATRLPIEGRSTVHVTIAAPEDAPIDPRDALLLRLTRALRAYGDPLVPIIVEQRHRLLLVLSAKLRLQSGHRWSVVEPRVRAAVLGRFSFERRALGEDALLSDVFATIHDCDGVDYVDVDGWGALKTIGGATPESIAQDLAMILAPPPGTRRPDSVVVPPARMTAKIAAPAGLAYLDPDLPQTFLLSEASNAR